MEQRGARQILQTLAQGRDPFTGAELPPDTLLQHIEVVRALLAAVAALEISAAREQRRAQLPGNVGRPWTESEEQDLVLAFRTGEQLDEIAGRHGRSLTAIEARLEKLGFLSPEQRTTRNRYRSGGGAGAGAGAVMVGTGTGTSRLHSSAGGGNGGGAGGLIYAPQGIPIDALVHEADNTPPPLEEAMAMDTLYEDRSAG